MILSLDSSAVITWVLQEQGWTAVDRVLRSSKVDAVLAGPGLTEVIFRSRARGNASSPEHIASALAAQGIRIEPATEPDLVRAAELLELSAANPGPPKHRQAPGPTLSLGDAMILAVSERIGAVVLTGDKYWGWMLEQGLVALTVHTIR